MITYYKILDGIQECTEDEANWIRLQNPSNEEVTRIIETFTLPDDIFIAAERPDEVARLERIDHPTYDHCYELVVFDINPDSSLPMEVQLEPISFIRVGNKLITCSSHGAETLNTFMKKYNDRITNIETFIAYSLLRIYRGFARELDQIKVQIDKLDREARQTTKNEKLFLLADMEREMVFLDNTLKDQDPVVNELWENQAFVKQVNNPGLLYDVKLAQRHAYKMIKLYRDLLTAIGSLISDMMSNRLNLLMKYLNSAALIISIPTLITGIWGMNNQVPGENSATGFWLVILLCVIATLASAIFLKFKDFSE